MTHRASRRVTGRFQELKIAVRFQRKYWEEEETRKPLNLPPLSKNEFLGVGTAGQLIDGPRVLVPIPLIEMIDTYAAILAKETRKDAKAGTPVNTLKRFCCDVLSGRYTATTVVTSKIEDELGTIDLDDGLSEEEQERVRRYYKTAVQAAYERASKLEAMSHDITTTHADLLPGWLDAENYPKAHAKAVIRLAKGVWSKADEHDNVLKRLFATTEPTPADLPQYDRKGRDRTAPDAFSFTEHQLVALARLLRPVYLLAFWLCVGLGFRRSEIFGLRLHDWDSDTRDLYLRRQRKWSPLKGLTSLKRADAGRPMPVPEQMAVAIDDYVVENHPPAPTDPQERAEWGKRYLLVGIKGGPMDPQSFSKAVRRAARAAGLTELELGRFRPVHHLRKTLGAYLQSLSASVSGRAVSVLLGHRVDGVNPDNVGSRVTRQFYNPVILRELLAAVAAVDAWFVEMVFPLLGTDNLLDVGGIGDPIGLDQVLELLHDADPSLTADDVTAFVRGGVLMCIRVNFTNGDDHQAPVYSSGNVQELVRVLMRSEAETYCASEVAELLAVDVRRVPWLASERLITHVASDPRTRKSARGNTFGGLPGGGHRYDRPSVDALVESEALAINRRRDWLTVGQTAELLSLSPDTVRRLADDGTLVSWRDPWATKHPRLLEPASVSRYAAEFACLSYGQTAALLGVNVKMVVALLKVGELAQGRARNSVLERSVIAYADRVQARWAA